MQITSCARLMCLHTPAINITAAALNHLMHGTATSTQGHVLTEPTVRIDGPRLALAHSSRHAGPARPPRSSTVSPRAPPPQPARHHPASGRDRRSLERGSVVVTHGWAADLLCSQHVTVSCCTASSSSMSPSVEPPARSAPSAAVLLPPAACRAASSPDVDADDCVTEKDIADCLSPVCTQHVVFTVKKYSACVSVCLFVCLLHNRFSQF